MCIKYYIALIILMMGSGAGLTIRAGSCQVTGINRFSFDIAYTQPQYNIGNQKHGYKKAKYPNIIFILADDMGYGDLGCYNPDSLRATGQLFNLGQDPYKKINLWESKTSIRGSLAALLEKVKSHPGSNLNYLKSY